MKKPIKIISFLLILALLLLSISCKKGPHILSFNSVSTSLETKFSYSYGYLIISNLKDNNISINAPYFSKGIIDAFRGESIYSDIDMYNYISQFRNEYILGDKTITNNEVVKSMSEIEELPSPSNLEEEFSYSYGYLTTLDIINNKIEIEAESYIEGVLTLCYDLNPLYSQEQMESFIDEYISKLQSKLRADLEKEGQENLKKANSFLDENKKKPDIVTLNSGVQLLFTEKSDEGAIPTKEDSVYVDYELKLLDGTVVDSGSNVLFSLTSLIPGFVDAVVNMKVGDEVVAYIPPSLGYGENSSSPIGPNSLLIFTIKLLGIK